uniref:SUMO-conjugating enzyme UBC9 n=1 Tax=Chromera velia CCMP2878 TaxID=1169474 RepID=A0A0G4G5Z4_9ALVE|mmetsp:Transcript_35786/g.70483  ORF Transcript_35786/g.70483 Transcript_35786/m.70483 type:complete len:163 (+) Transcript_35786:156-644(+)|eukprot:Cvel_20320.t1-p1 / transcript=Cvel_20320.t1 / gene=Cvel_20320 / organism=Chromera_velia_CCMP2878 / gene_product=Sumo-conjugating enzyme ubc9, putative / transcript_product=Sumo-conjugating enzyme ubc9, putative / location=Cvel_scaffold1814:36158-36643(+) / protein_length=162 / sequence_SO=supercontig / SO=protein_coding / is_pseudo=false
MRKIASTRIMQERSDWRKDHPAGFVAKFRQENGEQNVFAWDCKIPGKSGTPWEGGLYALSMEFPEEYPGKPPKCRFTKKPVLPHPNIYPSGTVCLSILNEDEDWKPSITVKQILLGIQELLGNPNPDSPAQAEPLRLFNQNKEAYEKQAKTYAKDCRPDYQT